ncbi:MULTISPECIES: putative bifunctional diguanylate cyclase/phosphodiesterase [unclassified Brevundimonas]|uniref:putative bifunctional diguanylate cyclase/phosphodiesterase n=1 Tax=unclassified Brevundimonas TaxID=2622653 RepID=UPI0025BC082A|nr:MULTISPECIES: EAL domain-containing protein [unclassified Brevundimonas]
MLKLQNGILELVARGEPLGRTLHALCARVEARLPGVLCSIVAVDAGGRLRPLAAPGLPASFGAEIDGVQVGPDVGACGTAIHSGEPVECPDIRTDPRWDRFAEIPLGLGLKACWSVPVHGKSDEVLGAFALYFREARRHTPHEAEVVEASIHLCAIAVERARQASDQYRLAYIDMLTELPNRAAFNLPFGAREEAPPTASAVLVIDLDNLKTVNDTFGHRAGDCLLKAAAAAIEKGASPHTAYRLGGDEFAVVIRDDGEEAAAATMEKRAKAILKALAHPIACDGHRIIPRATIGGASQDGGTSVELLRQNADFALYHAKETRRGGFVAYSAGLGTTMTRRLTAIREVAEALQEDRIDAHYQPIVRVDTGEIVGLEALFRVVLPSGETQAAGDYMEAVSDPHTATLLTRRMLDIVARDIRSWLDLGIWFQHVGINASSADFQGGRLMSTIRKAFDREDVPLEHVILEVTESVYMGRSGEIAREIQSLRENGLRVALDDFGTGFASLTHLLSLPVDIIKIDKSFIARMEPESRSAAIVEGLVSIASKLGIRVVAEGVETQEQAALLERFGCALGQGFLYAKPADRQTVTRLLFERAQRRDPEIVQASSAGTRSQVGARSAKETLIRYAVLRCGREWRVVSERRQLGHFGSRSAALQCALRLAREANASGAPVELLYTETGGELRALLLSEVEITEAALDLRARWTEISGPADETCSERAGGVRSGPSLRALTD